MYIIFPKTIQFKLDKEKHTVAVAEYFRNRPQIDITSFIPNFVTETAEEGIEKIRDIFTQKFPELFTGLKVEMQDFYLNYEAAELTENRTFRNFDLCSCYLNL